MEVGQRKTSQQWEQKLVGKFQVDDKALKTLQSDNIIAIPDGQLPLRGLLLSVTCPDRSSRRLDELLSSDSLCISLPDKVSIMLKQMVERVHGSGICRLNLTTGNIRLVDIGNGPWSKGREHRMNSSQSDLNSLTASPSAKGVDAANAFRSQTGKNPDLVRIGNR